MGTITVWLLFLAFCFGILLIFTKFFKKVNVDNYFVKLVVVLEFLARSSLINIHFGHLLYQFFDRIFTFDMWFMWKIVDETGIRGRLGGRLDEYRVPLLVVNANILALAVYLASAILALSVKIILRTPKTTRQLQVKNIVESFHFLVLGGTILDITFYSTLQLRKGFTTQSTGAIVSLCLCIVSLLFAVFDIFNIFKPIFVNHSDKIKVLDSHKKEVTRLRSNPELKFCLGGYHHVDGVSSSRIMRSLNPLFVLRFILSQFMISLFQENTKIQTIGLLVITTSYSLYMLYAMYTHRKQLKSPSDTVLRLIVEFCLTVLVVTFIIYESDPEGTRYSSAAREFWEITSICAVFLAAFIQSVRLFFSWLKQISSKEKHISLDYKISEIQHDKKQNKKMSNSQAYAGVQDKQLKSKI